MEAAGARIAELTQAEWGIVTCGSAAAVALGTAAAVAGNDPVKMLRLPFTDGMVNRVIIPSQQRFAYDQAVRMIGCHIVEIDTRAELDKALEEPVAMVVLLGKQEHLTPVRLEEFAAVCRPRGIPIMVDAASEHIERPSPWLKRGADLVIYSGGKFLRGPQTSGLLLGDKKLVQAAWRNSSPHQALGRPMKVSKEDIVGVIAALEVWFGERDTAAEYRKWRDACATIAARVAQIPGVRRRDHRALGRRSCAALQDHLGPREISARRARPPPARASTARPRVMLDDNSATENSISVEPFQLQPGEAEQVGDAVRRGPPGRRPGRTRPRPAPRPSKSPAPGNLPSTSSTAPAPTASTCGRAAPTSPATSNPPPSKPRRRRNRRRRHPLLVRRPARCRTGSKAA